MKDYMVVHYDGDNTHLTYTDTEEDARAYLAALITTNQVSKNDTLSIVRVWDDSIVYFKRRNNTLKSVWGTQNRVTFSWGELGFNPFQELVARLNKKLVSLGIVSGTR